MQCNFAWAPSRVLGGGCFYERGIPVGGILGGGGGEGGGGRTVPPGGGAHFEMRRPGLRSPHATLCPNSWLPGTGKGSSYLRLTEELQEAHGREAGYGALLERGSYAV